MNSKNNILLGLDADNKKLFVENNDYRHIMLIAPHGSGKRGLLRNSKSFNQQQT